MGAESLKRSKKKNRPFRRFLLIILAIILLLGVGVIVFTPDLVEQSAVWLYPLNYKDYVLEYSEIYGVDPYLVLALIRTESAFDPEAVSSAGAIGLCQIMPETGEWLASKMGMEVYSEDMLTIPTTSIEMSCYYIDLLLDRYSDTNTALAAYNAGMGNVSGWLEDSRYSEDGVTLSYIPYDETRGYVEKINSAKETYTKLYPSLIG